MHDRAAQMKAITECLEGQNCPRASRVLRATAAVMESNPEMPSEWSLPLFVVNFLTDSEYRWHVMPACTNREAIHLFGRGDMEHWYDRLSEQERYRGITPILVRMHALDAEVCRAA